jgi:hypothetical protein
LVTWLKPVSLRYVSNLRAKHPSGRSMCCSRSTTRLKDGCHGPAKLCPLFSFAAKTRLLPRHPALSTRGFRHVFCGCREPAKRRHDDMIALRRSTSMPTPR